MSASLRVRCYGRRGPWVVALHGGPGAPGSMAPLARELAGRFRVVEPLQRRSGGEALTVARHVADLHDVVTSRCPAGRTLLLGHSWGAMLALAYAARHPDVPRALVLVGCGTFDPVAREKLHETRRARMDDALRARLDGLASEFPDPDERLRALGELTLPVYSWDVARASLELERCDERGHRETWADMMRLQSEGIYPRAFASIDVPVLMLHGAADPHPGGRIRASLEPYLAGLEYKEWERCGHYPWLERHVRAEFLALLRTWMLRA